MVLNSDGDGSDFFDIPEGVDLASLGGGIVAYIREIEREKAEILLGVRVRAGRQKSLFCVYMADGTPFSISASREAAVANAFEHNLTPVSVH